MENISTSDETELLKYETKILEFKNILDDKFKRNIDLNTIKALVSIAEMETAPGAEKSGETIGIPFLENLIKRIEKMSLENLKKD